MTYTEQDLRTIKQIKAAARAVVTLSSGLVCGAQQLRGSVSMLPQGRRFAHPAVDAFLQVEPDSICHSPLAPRPKQVALA